MRPDTVSTTYGHDMYYMSARGMSPFGSEKSRRGISPHVLLHSVTVVGIAMPRQKTTKETLKRKSMQSKNKNFFKKRET
jgi:hypothetical protein